MVEISTRFILKNRLDFFFLIDSIFFFNRLDFWLNGRSYQLAGRKINLDFFFLVENRLYFAGGKIDLLLKKST